jgi:beta-lactamase class A
LLIFKLAASLILLGVATVAAAQTSNLQAELERVTASVGGSVGIGVRHLESGRELYVNRGVRYPMASVFKVPVAIQLLAMAEEGRADLDKTVELRASDLRPGSGGLVKDFVEPRRITIRELLETMLIDSDATATDYLLSEIGGLPAVRAQLQKLGLDGISVDRSTGHLQAAALGFDDLPADVGPTASEMDRMIQMLPRSRRAGRIAAFMKDERDTARPEALVAMLTKVWNGEALGQKHTKVLIEIMHRCRTGKGRLPAGLPPGTKVARKTGTFSRLITNDAGIITLPGKSGHVVVTVQIKGSGQTLEAQERAIAEVARAVYEHFTPRAQTRREGVRFLFPPLAVT